MLDHTLTRLLVSLVNSAGDFFSAELYEISNRRIFLEGLTWFPQRVL
jgi:hypothetical protein